MEGKWPSGRRRQTVNLLVNTLVGSNPTFLRLLKLSTLMFLGIKKKLRLNTRYLNRRIKSNYANATSCVNIQIKTNTLFFKLFKIQKLKSKCVISFFLMKMFRHQLNSKSVRISRIQPFERRKLFFNSKLVQLIAVRDVKMLELYNNHLFTKHFHKVLSKKKKKRKAGFFLLGNLYDIIDTNQFFDTSWEPAYRINPPMKSTVEQLLTGASRKTLFPYWYLDKAVGITQVRYSKSKQKISKKLFLKLLTRLDCHVQLNKTLQPNSIKYLPKFYNAIRLFFEKQALYSIFIRKNFHLTKFSNIEPLHMRLMLRYKFRRLMLILFRTTRRYSTHYDPMFLHEPIMSLNPGLMMPYFNKKKSLRKKKPLTLLLFRILRKILIVANVSWLYYQIRGIPIFLPEYLRHIQRPIAHVFTNPVTGEVVNEVEEFQYRINSLGVKFDNGKPNCVQKIKKAGRLKRKISRKLTRLCNIAD